MVSVQPETLESFVKDILRAAGAREEGAALVARSLVGSNLAGHDSHGVIRVPEYLNTAAAGRLDLAAEPQLIQITPSVAKVDGRHGFGQVTADFAVRHGVGMVEGAGLAAIGLANCQHVGRLGEWVDLAASEGVIGLAFANGGSPGGRVVPHGSAEHFLGTNPVAAAVPVANEPPIVVDFATSVVAEGKVRVARNKGETLPEGLIQDRHGRPATDPNALYDDGGLLTMAGHKGSALSLLVELLGGALTDQGIPGLPSYDRFRNGVLFLFLSIGLFRSSQAFLDETAEVAERVRGLRPAPGFDSVMMPGDPERAQAERRSRDGIPIDPTTWAQLAEVASGLGVEVLQVE